MKRLAAAALVSLLCATPLTAQDVEGICAGLEGLALGEWAEYRMDAPFGVTMEVRYAIVGEETVEGEGQYWLELNAALPAGSMILQFLVPDYPFQAESVRRVVMKMGPGQAMEFPEEMAGSMLQQGQSLSEPTIRACNESETIGWETVTVPAGTFRALRVRARLDAGDKDLWLSDDVPFGMIKMTEPDDPDHGLMLLDHGTDAESSITETPQKMAAPDRG